MKISETVIDYFKKVKSGNIVKKHIEEVETRIEELKNSLKNINNVSATEYGAELKGIDYTSHDGSSTPRYTQDAGFVDNIINLDKTLKRELGQCYEQRETLKNQLYNIKIKIILIESSLKDLEDVEREMIELYFDKKMKKAAIGERLNYSESYVSRSMNKALEKTKKYLEENIEYIKNKMVC